MSECIDAYAPDWGKVFSEYQERRKVNADAIAAMAIENFVRKKALPPVLFPKDQNLKNKGLKINSEKDWLQQEPVKWKAPLATKSFITDWPK